MRTFSGLARQTAARFIPRFADPVQCGGCGRRKAEVRHMVAGPRVYFCSDCFERATQQLAPRRPPVDGVRCRFCRQLRAPSNTATVGDVVICADCLGFMDVILAEAAQPL